MANMTIKGMPGALLDQLKARAASNRRSLNAEVIAVLETAVSAAQTPEQSVDWAGFRRQTMALRERLRHRYGELEDSTELIREAREDR